MKTVDCKDRRWARRIVAAAMGPDAGVVVADRSSELGRALLVLEETSDVTLTSSGPNLIRPKLTARGAVWLLLNNAKVPEIISHDDCGAECGASLNLGNVNLT